MLLLLFHIVRPGRNWQQKIVVTVLVQNYSNFVEMGKKKIQNILQKVSQNLFFFDFSILGYKSLKNAINGARTVRSRPLKASKVTGRLFQGHSKVILYITFPRYGIVNNPAKFHFTYQSPSWGSAILAFIAY